jgi:hypothetical protein
MDEKQRIHTRQDDFENILLSDVKPLPKKARPKYSIVERRKMKHKAIKKAILTEIM